MTTKEVKKMVNTIIDMNDTDTRFAYSAGATYYPDGSVIVDCTVKSRKTGDTRCVQDYKGDIFERIDDARNELIVSGGNIAEEQIIKGLSEAIQEAIKSYGGKK